MENAQTPLILRKLMENAQTPLILRKRGIDSAKRWQSLRVLCIVEI